MRYTFAALAAFLTVTQTATLLMLCAQSDATRNRHAVEQTQFVCLDDHDRITSTDAVPFAECTSIVYRHADEPFQ